MNFTALEQRAIFCANCVYVADIQKGTLTSVFPRGDKSNRQFPRIWETAGYGMKSDGVDHSSFLLRLNILARPPSEVSRNRWFMLMPVSYMVLTTISKEIR